MILAAAVLSEVSSIASGGRRLGDYGGNSRDSASAEWVTSSSPRTRAWGARWFLKVAGRIYSRTRSGCTLFEQGGSAIRN